MEPGRPDDRVEVGAGAVGEVDRASVEPGDVGPRADPAVAQRVEQLRVDRRVAVEEAVVGLLQPVAARSRRTWSGRRACRAVAAPRPGSTAGRARPPGCRGSSSAGTSSRAASRSRRGRAPAPPRPRCRRRSCRRRRPAPGRPRGRRSACSPSSGSALPAKRPGIVGIALVPVVPVGDDHARRSGGPRPRRARPASQRARSSRAAGRRPPPGRTRSGARRPKQST